MTYLCYKDTNCTCLEVYLSQQYRYSPPVWGRTPSHGNQPFFICVLFWKSDYIFKILKTKINTHVNLWNISITRTNSNTIIKFGSCVTLVIFLKFTNIISRENKGSSLNWGNATKEFWNSKMKEVISMTKEIHKI